MVAAIVVVLVLVQTGAALASGDANRGSCPASTESVPGFRPYLPDCRAYELVTPPYKQGTQVFTQPAAISSEGARVIVGGGAFAGVGNFWWDATRNPESDTYELSRTSSGWQPLALTPPATTYPTSSMMAASAEGAPTTLWGAATTNLLYNESIFLRRGATDLSPVGPGVAPELTGEELKNSTEELGFAGASSNLTRALFSVSVAGANTRAFNHDHSNVWPGDTTKAESHSLYEYIYDGASASEPTLVGVKNEAPIAHDAEAQLISSCGTELGSTAGDSTYNAVSDNGETVFFTALAAEHEISPGVFRCSVASEVTGPRANELYARVGGARTVAVSEPSKADCGACATAEPKNAIFEGASQNGAKVFFLTDQSLLPGQEGLNLYEYDFNGPVASPEHPDGKISLVSDGSLDPQVQGVVRVSENGERVYFVAKGKLAPRNAEGAEPEEGADNLYVYEPNPSQTGAYRTVFVAKLLTSNEETASRAKEQEEASTVKGLAERAAIRAKEEALSHGASLVEADEIASEEETRQGRELKGTLGPSGTIASDEGVWQLTDQRPAQTTPDGEFLVFSSSANLTRDDESKSVPQLFEYNAGSEALTRVSIGQNGAYNHDGAVDTFRAAPQLPIQSFATVDLPTSAGFKLALSNDGSKIVFTSAASLTPEATPRTTSVYEYSHGNVYLISDGKDASVEGHSPTVQLLGTDPAGTDVFFLSADALVPQDEGETNVALYDAREEGGFLASAPPAGCGGETCRGQSGTTPQLQSAGSTTQLGGDNLPPPIESTTAAKSKPNPLTRAQKLKNALKACRAKRSKKKRASCEARARKAYAARMKATKSTSRTR